MSALLEADEQIRLLYGAPPADIIGYGSNSDMAPIGGSQDAYARLENQNKEKKQEHEQQQQEEEEQQQKKQRERVTKRAAAEERKRQRVAEDAADAQAMVEEFTMDSSLIHLSGLKRNNNGMIRCQPRAHVISGLGYLTSGELLQSREHALIEVYHTAELSDEKRGKLLRFIARA